MGLFYYFGSRESSENVPAILEAISEKLASRPNDVSLVGCRRYPAVFRWQVHDPMPNNNNSMKQPKLVVRALQQCLRFPTGTLILSIQLLV